jgi:hypothetical protein
MKLTAELFHEASRTEQIGNSSRDARMYCFIDDGALVVLTHGAVRKRRRQTEEIARAVSCRNAYLAARQRGDLQWEKLDDE